MARNRKMNILVTGHKGFVGKHLFEHLEKDGHNVIGYDLGDTLPQVPVDLVYHLAAYPKALESIEHPEMALGNINITFKVLDWMRTSNCKKIIYASSTKIPGLDTPYSASKIASENLIEAFCKSYGIGGVCIRFNHIYGPNDREDRFIPTVVRNAKKNADIEIYGEEGSFLYIDDCINIYMNAQNNIVMGKNKIYVISDGKESLTSVAKKIIQLTGSKSRINLDTGLKKIVK